LKLGGILICLSGCAGIIGGAIVMGLSGELRSYGYVGAGDVETCGLMSIVASIIPIVGGTFAMMGRYLSLVIVAGVVGIIVCVFLFGLLGLAPGLIGVILIAISHRDFME
jgi:hypothetical protein